MKTYSAYNMRDRAPGRAGRAAEGVPRATRTPRDERTGPGEIERERGEIERVSPEGRPAHPEYKAREIGLLIGGAVVFALVVSIVVALTAGLAAGAVVLVFGLGLAILLNPEIWAASLRAKERDQIEHEHDKEPDA